MCGERLAQKKGFVITMLCSRLQIHTSDVACGRGVLYHNAFASLSEGIAWKGAVLYNALEYAHLFTTQGRGLQGGTRGWPPGTGARF
jgi:hypothetical protein